jgi:PKD repeat protein
MAVKNMGWPTGDFTNAAAFSNPNSLFNAAAPNYYRGWAIYLNHLVNDYSTMTPFLNYIDANRDRLWFCTFTEGIKYGQERDTATLTVTSNTAEQITMTLTDRMLDSRFDYPLTLKVRIPNSWNGAAATQAGVPVDARLVEHNGDKYALVQAVPDQGEIALMPGDAVTFSASPLSGWTPLAVTFTDTSTFGGITNRFWDFGDGTTTNTTAASVSHAYISAGTRTVQLVVSTAEGSETNTQANLIQVTDPVVPSAGFNVSPTSGPLPLAVTFTDTSTGSITNRFWDFGDGTTTNTQATGVAHTYTAQGTCTVTLVASGPLGADTNTQTDVITVTAPIPPTAEFGLYPESGPAPLEVSFADSSTGLITNRFWDFGDGTTTNTSDTGFAHTYTDAGTYTIQLVVSGPAGSGTNTQVDAVVVSAPPPSSGGLVHLNISSAFDYDGFVTDEEIAYATGLGQLVPVAIGDHADDYASVRPGNGYSHIVTPNHATYQGIPADGIVDGGNFALANGLSVKWGVAAGNAPVDNSVARFYDGVALVKSATVTLNPADQKKYTGLNVLVNGSRYATLAGTMSATLSVKYVGDATWYTVWTESVSTGLGGVFGGEFSGDTGTQSKQSSAWTAVTVSDDGYSKVGSGLTVTGPGSSYMYKLTTPAVLDETKVLEAFQMEATTYSKSRVNEFQLFAASATEASGSSGGDSDTDGIPDEWETEYFGGSTNANPNAMAANGMNTIREAYVAGLNPTNPASVLLISDFRPLTSASTLQWQSVSGRVYSVHWTTNLFAGFQPLETNIVWPQNSWTDAVHGVQDGGFYKIKVELGQ